MRMFKPMPETTDTHELLRRIELKDSKFRIAQSTFFAVIFAALVAVLILSFRLESQSKSEIDGLQNHIDCIVSLFGQPNRQSLVISNIENCKIEVKP